MLRKRDLKKISCKEDKDILSEAGDIEIAGHGLANVGFQYNEILKRITKHLYLKKESMDKKGVFRFQGLSQLGRSSVIENPVLYAIDVKHR